MPHILPCPGQHRVYADGEMPPNGKRKHQARPTGKGTGQPFELPEVVEEGLDAERRPRKCPVPKPRGPIRGFLAFVQREEASGMSDRSHEPPFQSRNSR